MSCRLLPRDRLKGFTLIELAIVILVIGLIISGITAGRSLVTSAKLRAQASDLQSYTAAFNAFSLQYNAVAGDIKNASSYWPTASNIKNGNGNGYLDDCATCGPTDTTSEGYTIFQHLSLAKLIPGYYNNTYSLGVGYPAMRTTNNMGIRSGSYIGENDQLSTAQANLKHKAVIYLAIPWPDINDWTYNDGSGTLSVMEAYSTDMKMDDGIARKGVFRAYGIYGPQLNCLKATDGDYEITTNKYKACMGEYILK